MGDKSKSDAKSREVDAVEIVVLVDNVVDVMSSVSRPDIKRTWWLQDDDKRPTSETMPWAEHGFSALIRVRVGDRRHSLLFDAGATGTVALHNAACFRFAWGEIDAVSLSHSHFDHTGGLPALLEQAGQKPMPIIVHDDMFVERGALNDKGQVDRYREVVTREQLTRLGAELIANREPHPLFGGAVVVLGEIPRQTDFEPAHHPRQVRRDGEGWSPDPWDWDDRGLVISVRDEGIVILSGCAHAGIINTILHAQTVTHCEQVRAVIGGFHLSGSKFEPHIERTVQAFKALQPELLVPLHCTGPRASEALVAAMPKAVVRGGVLMRIRVGRWDD